MKSDYIIYLTSVKRSVKRHLYKKKCDYNFANEWAGDRDLRSPRKKLSLSNFLNFWFCCVKFLVETHIQICLFFIPSESIAALFIYLMILEEKHLHSGFV